MRLDEPATRHVGGPTSAPQTRWNPFLVAALLFLGLLGTNAEAKVANTNSTSLQSLWNSGNYQALLDRLFEIRKRPGGQNATVDFWIAVCWSRIPGHRQDAINRLALIADRYELDDLDRKLVQDSMQRLRNNQDIDVKRIPSEVTPGTGGTYDYLVNGLHIALLYEQKGMHIEGYVDIEEVPTERVKLTDTSLDRLSPSPVSERGNAEDVCHLLLGAGSESITRDHFVLGKTGDMPSLDLYAVGSDLESLLNFYAREFHLPVPSTRTSVFFVRNADAFRNLSRLLYGATESFSPFAFSVERTVSIIVQVPESDSYVVGHEDHAIVSLDLSGLRSALRGQLFGLMSHYAFGDMPAWLYYGMSVLYLGTDLSHARVTAHDPNIKISKSEAKQRPAVSRLLAMKWRDFDELNRRTAQLFVQYLHSKEKLNKVYTAFRDEQSRFATDNVPAADVKTFEMSVGESIDSVDASFSQWLAQRGRLGP